jgi:hypothetical protein
MVLEISSWIAFILAAGSLVAFVAVAGFAA